MNPHLSERNIERVVNTILDRICDVLVAGGRVDLRRFGTFTVTKRAARKFRNPGTGGNVRVEAKKQLKFKPCGAIHARLNPSGIVTGTELDAEDERLSQAS